MDQQTKAFMKLLPVQHELRACANPAKRLIFMRFFKTGKGEYAEGDAFLGVTVPQSRIIAKKYRELGTPDITVMLCSPIHEDRFVALCILVYQYRHMSVAEKNRIARLYLKYIDRSINNWDLVDTSAEHIIGEYVFRTGSTALLKKLARSQSLWERRVAIIATFYNIKQQQSALTFAIAELLLDDAHDLIHKAVGWMLREVGKRCGEAVLCSFLDTHARTLPRTTLRYAIEHFSPALRKHYMTR